ncbi:hypothetical protein Hokovirus_1_187 [Hokovirus HKV1]|uniref:Uncharacterized protein n=1 Tax=Hokovirus HKV1 TaxID=1977638 RepID=A0A1V0SF93_9VIRU|nr:hypothetical protein Hokovirus_1_187 [Hokovirus HKV1]
MTNELKKIQEYIILENNICELPTIPFFWYRTLEIFIPIIYKNTILDTTDLINLINENYNIDITFKNNKETSIIIQNHVLDTDIYLSLHTYFYCKENEDRIIKHDFIKNWHTEILLNDLILNTSILLKGNVHIHDSSFSPPNCMNLNLSKDNLIYVFHLKIDDNDILFIIFNELTENNKKNVIIDYLFNLQ